MKVTITKNSSSLKFKEVELRVPKVADMIAAERMAGADAGELRNSAALLAVIGVFDGKKVVMEDILNLELSDFLELQEGSRGLISEELATQLSTSSKKEILDTKA